MFTGEYIRSIDSKKRVILPPNIKNSLGNVFYLSIADEHKLILRPVEEFENFVNKIDENNQLDRDVQKYKRFIMSSTIKIETDKLGRFLIPDKFISAAAVKTTVTFVGMNKFIEIWASEVLAKQQQEFEDEEFINEMSDKLLKKGIKL